MKRFFACLFASLLALPLTLLPFVVLNNVTLLPWNIARLLWYGFPPLLAFVLAILYGAFRFKKGGALFFAALFFAAGIYAANRYAMPFATDLTNIPCLAAAAVFTLIGESCGHFIAERKIKKRNANRAPLYTD